MLLILAKPPKNHLSPPTSLEDGRNFWAFKKPQSSPRPKTRRSDWPTRELDYFILATLERNHLEPSLDAEPAVLLRRLHFHLTGLPPSFRSTLDFLALTASQGIDHALGTETDRLLDSPRYGEHWARHWMDVARFAESSGKESNLTFPHAWRYRDYAIDAFNADIPFDRFLTEQLAGDLLPADTDEERARLLIATGFLAFGAKGLNEMNDLQFAADLVDEQIDTVTRAFIGQSVACARCHDHKFDAFPMEDYYALAGSLRARRHFLALGSIPKTTSEETSSRYPHLDQQLIPNPSIPIAKMQELRSQLAQLTREKEAGAKSIRDALRIIWRTGGIEGKLETVDKHGNALPLLHGNTRPRRNS